MVENVERFGARLYRKPLGNLHRAAESDIHVEITWGAKSVVAGIAEGSGRVLREQAGIQKLIQNAVAISGVSSGGDHIGPVIANSGKRIVPSTGRVHRQPALIANQRGDVPVIGQPLQPTHAADLAHINKTAVE